jgi:hypothetical protein
MLCRCELWYNEILILKYLFAIEEKEKTQNIQN